MSKLVNPAWMCFIERLRGSASESLKNFGKIKSCAVHGQGESEIIHDCLLLTVLGKISE